MAFHHHHHNPAATCHCCCSQQPPPPPPQPTADPYHIAAIVSHILQTQTLTQNPPNLHNVYSQTPKPTSINRNQRCPHRESDQFQNPQTGFFSLLQRIDALEEALHRYSSSSSSLSIRDVAARTIQTHFRVYLVRRSRALGHLKDLASIKTAVGSLKSSFSRRGFVDLDSLSSRAMELLLLLDTIRGEDKMIRDSKMSITNEIAQFLDSLDGVCVRRHQVVTKTMRNMRLARNDNTTSHDHAREFSERGVGSKCRIGNDDGKKLHENLKGRGERGSKCQNMSYDLLENLKGRDERGSKCRNMSDDEKKLHENLKGRDERGSKCRNMSDDEKKLLENLKGRVERINRLSREIDNEEEDAQTEGYKHDGCDEGDDDDIVGNSSNHRMENRGLVKNHLLHPDGKKRVSFEEDGNVVRVYDIDENTSSDVNEVEDYTKGVQDVDEDDAWNHVHRSM